MAKQIQMVLKQRLEERGMTRYRLAQMTGIHYATITRYYHNTITRYDADSLQKFCEALDCQPGDLLVLTETDN